MADARPVVSTLVLPHDVGGTGRQVLLLHSGVADRRMWAGIREGLPTGLRVIAPDLRGFGAAAMPPAGTAYTDSDDVAAVLDWLGVESAVVVGSSLGGRVALELATIRPDLVDTLVLLCPAYRGVEPSARAREFAEHEDRLLEAGDIDGAVALNVRTWLGPRASVEARAAVTAMQRRAFALKAASGHPGPDRVDPRPEGLAVPTLVVVGEQDMDHFVAVGEHLAEVVPGAMLMRLPWAGHLPAVEWPEEIASLLTPWLGRR